MYLQTTICARSWRTMHAIRSLPAYWSMHDSLSIVAWEYITPLTSLFKKTILGDSRITLYIHGFKTSISPKISSEFQRRSIYLRKQSNKHHNRKYIFRDLRLKIINPAHYYIAVSTKQTKSQHSSQVDVEAKARVDPSWIQQGGHPFGPDLGFIHDKFGCDARFVFCS